MEVMLFRELRGVGSSYFQNSLFSMIKTCGSFYFKIRVGRVDNFSFSGWFDVEWPTFIPILTILCLILCFDHDDILNAECPSRFVNFYWSRVDLEGRGVGGCWTSEIKSRPPGGAGELQLNSGITFTFIFVFHNIYLII